MDYQDYGINDFLLDDSFCQYCAGINPVATDFWQNWTNAHPEKASDIAKARSLYYILNGQITPQKTAADYQVMEDVFARHQQEKQLPVKSSNIRPLWWRLASMAACLLVVIAIYLHKTKTQSAQQYVSAPGRKLKVNLPDGTTVILNGDSRLTLGTGFNKSARNVNLDGEGYFVVKHNVAIPFTVHANGISIKDVGTIFNVKAYHADKTVETALIEGKIAISMEHKKEEVLLNPNQKFVWREPSAVSLPAVHPAYEVKTLTHTATDKADATETDWTRERLSFNNISLKELALSIERWYGVKIQIENTAKTEGHFTGSFTHSNPEQVLEALRLSGGLNYRKEGDVIIIY